MVGPDAAVGRETSRHRLVPTVHRHKREVDVDDEVGLGRAPVQRHLLAGRRLADVDVVLRVLAVVLVETVGVERREDPLSDDVAQLVLGHASVEAKRGDDVQIVDAGLGRHVDDLLHHQLPHVRRRHRRQRKREIVEGDRQLHAPAQQRLERVVLERLAQRALDRAFGMCDWLQWIGRVHDARTERHLLQPDAFSEVKEHRRRVAIDFYDRARARHQWPVPEIRGRFAG